MMVALTLDFGRGSATVSSSGSLSWGLGPETI